VSVEAWYRRRMRALYDARRAGLVTAGETNERALVLAVCFLYSPELAEPF
jgi:hypothetical protein